MKFLADHCLNEHVARALEGYGHEVTRLRDIMAADTEDILVAQTALNGGLILITHDDDFRAQQRDFNRRTRKAYDEVHLLLIADLGPNTVGRLAEVMESVEFEFRLADKAKRRFFVEIALRRITIHR